MCGLPQQTISVGLICKCEEDSGGPANTFFWKLFKIGGFRGCNNSNKVRPHSLCLLLLWIFIEERKNCRCLRGFIATRCQLSLKLVLEQRNLCSLQSQYVLS
eukprot:XP_001707399.1 Hypothetical protein GL50803_31447 [Giardia lamblia ATCC 50803]